MTLEATEAECAAGRTAPRVSLADIEANVAERYDISGAEAITGGDGESRPFSPSLSLLSICIIVLNNGFTLIGKSAPASAENFDAVLGRKLAYEDALRQAWPLMGYELRERLYREANEASAKPQMRDEGDEFVRDRPVMDTSGFNRSETTLGLGTVASAPTGEAPLDGV